MAVSEYQVDALNFAQRSDSPALTWPHALERYFKLEGFHQGSVGGVENIQARIRDEHFAAAVDGAGSLTGLVPLPGAEKMPHAAAWAYGEAADLLADQGGTAAIAKWGNEAADVEAANVSTLVAGYEVSDRRLRILWNSRLPGLADSTGDSTYPSWSGGYRDDYSSHYSEALTAVEREGLAKAFEEARELHDANR